MVCTRRITCFSKAQNRMVNRQVTPAFSFPYVSTDFYKSFSLISLVLQDSGYL